MKRKLSILLKTFLVAGCLILFGYFVNDIVVYEQEKCASLNTDECSEIFSGNKWLMGAGTKEQTETLKNNISDLITGYIRVPDGSERGIACWGDSMMQGIGSSEAYIEVDGEIFDISYCTAPSTIAYFTSMPTYNFGVGGENSDEIALRAGGIPIYIDRSINITKEDGAMVRIIDGDGNVPEVMDYSGYGYEENEYPDTVYINDVLCQITRIEDSEEVYICICSEYEGNETTQLVVEALTRVIPKAAYDHCNDILILEIGSNGGWDNDYNTLIEQYKSIIKNSYYSDYIIVGDTDDPGMSVDATQSAYGENGNYSGLVATQWEVALSEAFGEHFLNTRLYILQNGLSDCGLNATMLDVLNTQKGIISNQLRIDYTHFNSYGYYSKGKAIYLKGVELGYWE